MRKFHIINSLLRYTLIIGALLVSSCAVAEETRSIVIENWGAIDEDRWPFLSHNAVYAEVSSKLYTIHEEGFVSTEEVPGWSLPLPGAVVQRLLSRGELGPVEGQSLWMFPLPTDALVRSVLLMPFYSVDSAERGDALRVEWAYQRQSVESAQTVRGVQVNSVGLQPLTVRNARRIVFGRDGRAALIYRDSRSGHAVAARRIALSGAPGDSRLWVHPGYDVQIMFSSVLDVRFDDTALSPEDYFMSDRVSVQDAHDDALVLNIAPREDIKTREVEFILNGRLFEFESGQRVLLRRRMVSKAYVRGGMKDFKISGSWIELGTITIRRNTHSIRIPQELGGVIQYGLMAPPTSAMAMTEVVLTGIELFSSTEFLVSYNFTTPVHLSELQGETEEKFTIHLNH